MYIVTRESCAPTPPPSAPTRKRVDVHRSYPPRIAGTDPTDPGQKFTPRGRDRPNSFTLTAAEEEGAFFLTSSGVDLDLADRRRRRRQHTAESNVLQPPSSTSPQVRRPGHRHAAGAPLSNRALQVRCSAAAAARTFVPTSGPDHVAPAAGERLLYSRRRRRRPQPLPAPPAPRVCLCLARSRPRPFARRQQLTRAVCARVARPLWTASRRQSSRRRGRFPTFIKGQLLWSSSLSRTRRTPALTAPDSGARLPPSHTHTHMG